MILSLDVGGTNIRSALVNGTNITRMRKERTPKKKKDILNKIIETIQTYPKTASIGISIAGFERDGKIVNALNTDINNVPLRKMLETKFKRKIFIDNDGNCAGLAELKLGAGKKAKNFILLTLGTGIGGAIIVNKEVYRGNGGAGEVGSMIINSEKIFESLASGNASVSIAKKSGFQKINSKELEIKANKGSKKALQVYSEVGHNLGIGLSNLAYIFDPDLLILGGGFTRVRHIHPEANRTFKKLYKLSPKPTIVKANFGDDAGLIGASLLPDNP